MALKCLPTVEIMEASVVIHKMVADAIVNVLKGVSKSTVLTLQPTQETTTDSDSDGFVSAEDWEDWNPHWKLVHDPLRDAFSLWWRRHRSSSVSF